MKTIQVDLGDRSYPIHIGSCFSDDALIRSIPNTEVVVVTNETVAPLYADQVLASLKRDGRRLGQVVLPDGEAYKTLDTVNRIFTYLLEGNFSRKVALVALGGGVVGDMTGYAAACYQRGVDFYQIPTTLLSQVDSSVGGKTGVNHVLGKNMIGAFKQPKAVFIDPETLKTLPNRELSAGFAEVVKHGVIADATYFEHLEANVESILALESDALVQVIGRSCEIKAGVVAKDETEQGVRATLNFGHTFGHAIETTLGYGQWLHGEAVAVGMVMAADLSVRLGMIDNLLVERVKNLLAVAGLPIEAPSGMTQNQFSTAMKRDKKVDAGALRLVLLQSLGKALVTADYPQSSLDETLAEFCRD
ncbi:3-dehydroquinate synthase [Reinekea blandensis]|uniref:3-dehydroquinate synthase n=1 Tax=Reinekea blandensis MED297 TaxID=314283 RepID=A4BAN7_9GAMM|nr:3-dehydroquinate synthase [Reinekea blandensis]EAR10993.1 3-dehydroquinate synthase [Reinekea sp. MED297] [Reinekea blandensis MED297]